MRREHVDDRQQYHDRGIYYAMNQKNPNLAPARPLALSFSSICAIGNPSNSSVPTQENLPKIISDIEAKRRDGQLSPIFDTDTHQTLAHDRLGMTTVGTSPKQTLIPPKICSPRPGKNGDLPLGTLRGM